MGVEDGSPAPPCPPPARGPLGRPDRATRILAEPKGLTTDRRAPRVRTSTSPRGWARCTRPSRAVDGVELDEAAHGRRLVGAVEQDAPDGRDRSPRQRELRAASARPRSRPCATRSAALRSGRRRAARRTRSGTPRRARARSRRASSPPLLDCSASRATQSTARTRYIVAGMRRRSHVGKRYGPDVRGDVEILGELVAVLVVVVLVGSSPATVAAGSFRSATRP